MTVQDAINIDFKLEYGTDGGGHLIRGTMCYNYIAENKLDNFDGRQFNSCDHINKPDKRRK